MSPAWVWSDVRAPSFITVAAVAQGAIPQPTLLSWKFEGSDPSLLQVISAVLPLLISDVSVFRELTPPSS